MDDAGRFAVSLLSGHLGGANQMAEQCALATGAAAVITTATDVHGLPSFDMLAKEQGWAIDDLSRVKTLNSLLLEGGEIAVVDQSGQVKRFVSARGNLRYHPDFQAALSSGAAGFLFVTNREIPPDCRQPNILVLRPRNLVLGIGCNSGTAAGEIEEVVLANLEKLSLSLKSICCLASAAAKRSEPGLLAFAEKCCISTTFYESAELNSVQSPSPPSAHAYEAIGAVGVAEPAALLASGYGTLLLNKVKNRDFLHKELSEKSIEASLEVMTELGSGFLESVYEKSVLIALVQKGITARSQAPLKVKFRGEVVGEYFADILVENKIIVALKTVKNLLPEHQAQVINYPRASGIDVGLLINFGAPKLEVKRLHK
jgi:cobalt-precorrin 5A hydrolase